MDNLNTFFDTQKNSPEWANGVKKTKGFSRFKEALKKEITTVTIPPSFTDMLIVKVCESLNLKFGRILAGGWRKSQEILKYKDKENPPKGYHEVTLLKHTLTSKHKPALKLKVEQNTIKTVNFDLDLNLKLSGWILYIKDGKIFKATTGTIQGSGTLAYDGFAILKKDTSTYKLSDDIEFTPPIKIESD